MFSSLKTVMVATDFSPCSASALRQAARLARASGARLHVVHAIDRHVLEDLEEAMSARGAEMMAHVEDDAQREWNRFASEISELPPATGGSVIKVLTGRPGEAIAEEARSSNADLLVLGTRGHSSSEGGIGMVAQYCVKRARTNVLLVREGQDKPFASVAACVDFSEISREALLIADVAARADDATLDALHVFQPPWKQIHYMAPAFGVDADFQTQFLATLERRLRGFVADALGEERADQVGLVLQEYHSSGAGVIRALAERATQLAVLGVRGRTNLRDVLLGSTADRVLRQVGCSVLTVYPKG